MESKGGIFSVPSLLPDATKMHHCHPFLLCPLVVLSPLDSQIMLRPQGSTTSCLSLGVDLGMSSHDLGLSETHFAQIHALH